MQFLAYNCVHIIVKYKPIKFSNVFNIQANKLMDQIDKQLKTDT